MNVDEETHSCWSSGDCSPSESSTTRLDLKLTRVLGLCLTGGGEEVLRVNQHRAHERNECTANNDLQVFALGGGLRF